jgi:hypothetical protein
MADPVDDAGEYNAVYQAAAFKSAGFDFENGSPALAPQTHPDFDGEHCVECGDDMPASRLLFRRVRCTSCEEDLARENKLRARLGRPE